MNTPLASPTSRQSAVHHPGEPEGVPRFDDDTNSSRVKVWGTAKVVADDPALMGQLRDPVDPGKVELVIVFTIEAWDVSCPQHIHKQFRNSR